MASKVKTIVVSNLKAVSAMSAEFNGCTAIIVGGNNKGKSSFLKSLPERLRGQKPDEVLKKGEKSGYAKWELTTGEKFVWEFDGKKEKLTFISEKNIPRAITKELSNFYFPPVFDVDTFLQAAPAKQKAILQKLTGIDFTEIDKLYQEAYETRTYANKRVQETKIALTGVPDYKMAKDPTPTDDLVQKLAGITSHNKDYENSQLQLQQKEKTVAENEKEIEELQNKIKLIEQKNSILNGEILELGVWLDDEANQPKTEKDTEALRTELQQVKDNNKAIEENNALILLQTAYDTAVKNANEADAEVKRIAEEKQDYIKNFSSMPSGFGFDDEGITYEGFSFNKEQLSSSRIYIAALKLAAVGLGEVRTLHFDASYLDKNSLAEIEKWANENDLQLLIERPDFEGGEIEYQIVQDAE